MRQGAKASSAGTSARRFQKRHDMQLDHFAATSYDIFFDIASSEFALDVLTETSAGLHAGFRLAALHSDD